MYQAIIVLGILLALVGAGTIAAGAPSWALGLGLGSSLIQSGSIGLVGGFLLVGIGFVLRALRDLSHRIDMISSGTGASRTAAPMPAGRPMARREPLPSRREPPLGSQRDDPGDPAFAEEADDGAFEELPRGRTWPPVTADSRQSVEPRANERSRAPAVEPRLNDRPRAPARSQAPDVSRPPDGGRARQSDAGRSRTSDDSSSTVVRSGIIHGMAYTLYADGSIEAELPIGTVRFASIEELQDHVSRTGDEADVDFAGKSN
jgi:hypothetical protein